MPCEVALRGSVGATPRTMFERLARRYPVPVHGLAGLPKASDTGPVRRPRYRASNEPLPRYDVGADQALVARVHQDDAVQHHGGVTVVGELRNAECPKPAVETGGAFPAVREDLAVLTSAAAQRAVSSRAAPTTQAPRADASATARVTTPNRDLVRIFGARMPAECLDNHATADEEDALFACAFDASWALHRPTSPAASGADAQRQELAARTVASRPSAARAPANTRGLAASALRQLGPRVRERPRQRSGRNPQPTYGR